MLTPEQELELTSGQECNQHRHNLVSSLTADAINAISNLEKEVVVTGAYTAQYSDDLLLCDSTSTALVVTLPAGRAGKKYTILRAAGTNSVTIQCSGSDTINGIASLVIIASFSPVRLKYTKTYKWVTV